MKKALVLTVFCLCLLMLPKAHALDGVEVLSGYLDAHLDHTQKNYQAVPLLVGLIFDMKPLTSKIGLNPKGRIDFILEPFINTVMTPNSNVEVGSDFLLQYAFPLTEKIQPYVKGGLGVLYMSQHTLEQSTQYNFLPQGAAGVRYFIKDNIALDLEYRYRHLSNAALKHPNSGIDANMYMGGITIFFDKGKTPGTSAKENANTSAATNTKEDATQNTQSPNN
ncbi:MAG: acyloxyacyl hydrolase [Candidatus Omnitrophica bacterium]|nr:acyloxyacyl hydrolase [Candidatus Omnitrophota bacterium]